MPVPFLTPRLAVRPFTVDDAPELHAVLYRDPEAMRFVGGPHTVEATRAGIERYIDQQEAAGYSFWAVEERESGLIAGEAGLFPLSGEGPEVELGYAFGRAYWGRGYATEVAGAIIAEAFGALGLERVVAVAKAENARSLHVLAKLGFRAEGEREAWGQRQLFFVRDRG